MLLSALFWACTLNDEAVMELPAPEESYFVEAYLAPGAPVRLAFMKTNSFQEDVALKLVEGARVELLLPEKELLLKNTVFADPKTGKLMNYNSSKALPRTMLTDSIRLRITTASGAETLYAATELVEPISINQWSLQEQRLKISFNNGSTLSNRYYSVYIQSIRGDEGIIRTLHYDYTRVNDEELTISIVIPEGEKPKRVILYRLTRENYDFQLALKKAIQANTDPFEAPQVVPTNIRGGQGLFTYFTADTLLIR